MTTTSDQRRVLVTGASRGIGWATARLLREQGHDVVGFARTRRPDFPGDMIQVDLSDRAATEEAALRALAGGTVDALVNNVGLVRPAKLGAVDLDDLAEVFDFNVRTAVQLVQLLTPGMRARGWGRVVNLTSIVTVGYQERTSYGAAKAALEFCTRAWSQELAADGVTVNAVAPGPTETDMFRAANPHGSPQEERHMRNVPLRRIGRPEEIAATIGFLLSDAAGFITGQTLRADGGASVGAPRE